MDNLLEYFTVEMTLPKQKGDPYRLTLLPRYDRIKKRIKSMRVDVDIGALLPGTPRGTLGSPDSATRRRTISRISNGMRRFPPTASPCSCLPASRTMSST